MAQLAARDGAILVAAGGDGTLNTVAHAAVEHGCVFGVLPQGTFNYFGRTHGIPEDLADAERALLRMLGLLVRGALGRLGEGEDVDAFAFRRMTVRAPLLSGRRRLKVATDGEVCRMALLAPDAEEGADTAAADAVEAR
jgi:predicted polyphosphate/ATP-dependent NAD kinase